MGSCISVVKISAGSAIDATSSTICNDEPWCRIHDDTTGEVMLVTQFTLGVQDGALGWDILQGMRRRLNLRPFDALVASFALNGFKKSFFKLENVDFVLVSEGTIPNKFWDGLKFRMDFDEATLIDGNAPIFLLDVYFGASGELGGNVRSEEFAQDFRFVFGPDLVWVFVGADVYADFITIGVLAHKVFVSSTFFFVHLCGLAEVLLGDASVTGELNDKLVAQGRSFEKFEVVWANISIDIKIVEVLFKRVPCELGAVV